jgi:predicted metal-dependent phosphoesterase TrpH
LAKAKRRGIACIAITDHNTVRGGLAAFSLAEADPGLPRVIPGVEVSTQSGEVVGLFVREEIPKGLPLKEAIRRIREQDGLVYLPHPYDRIRRGAIEPSDRLQAAESADIIEVMNGRAMWSTAGAKARLLASRLGKPAGAGSDAHRGLEVGTAYVVVDELPTRETLVALLAAGRVEFHHRLWDYLLNWGLMGLAPLTRSWRRHFGS